MLVEKVWTFFESKRGKHQNGKRIQVLSPSFSPFPAGTSRCALGYGIDDGIIVAYWTSSGADDAIIIKKLE